jgi:phage tail sheath protein FI
MPVTPTYPGVYIEEIPSSVRTITGVATSITAFIGRALRGPLDDPIRVQSYAEYQRTFGGLWAKSTLGYAIQHYFLNGGRDAIIVRVADSSAAAATITLTGGSGNLTLEAANPGDWGENLQVIVDYDTKDKDDASPVLFNLTIQEVEDGVVSLVETFRNLSVDEEDARYVSSVLENKSTLVRAQDPVPSGRPDESLVDPDGDYIPTASNGDGDDGGEVGFDQIAHADLEGDREGIWALEKADLFNLLCIPPFGRETDVTLETWSAALAYCKVRRAMLIVDPPADATDGWVTPADVADATDGVDSLGLRDENAALYFPRLKMADPLQENRLEEFAPCGAVTGIMARTDAQRGVWKAPAGQEATLLGVRGLAYKMTDGENGQLNPLGVNCLRTFPIVGHVVWGARTLEGADRLASEWKYLPVRRLALYIEESLYRGTQWVVFEPNDEPLWAQIRLNVGAFMHNLFRQGAFQGTSPREAYFVKCDSETTTQNDIDLGIVNILVGFAPLKPAEFVIIKISQIAGEIQT